MQDAAEVGGGIIRWDDSARPCPHADLQGDRESGHNTAEERARSRAAGFAEHLAKPLIPEDLDAAFERLMTDIDGK